MTRTITVAARRRTGDASRPSAKSGIVYAPKRRSGAATAASRTR